MLKKEVARVSKRIEKQNFNKNGIAKDIDFLKFGMAKNKRYFDQIARWIVY